MSNREYIHASFSSLKKKSLSQYLRIPRWLSGKKSACQCRKCSQLLRDIGILEWIYMKETFTYLLQVQRTCPVP